MKHITFNEPCFHIPIVFCWDADDEALAKFASKYLNIDTEGEHTGDGYFRLLTNEDGHAMGLMAMTTNVFTGTPYEYGILAHECLHATFKFLRSRGIRYNKSSEECFTYVMDSLIEGIATKVIAREKKLAAKSPAD